MPLPPLPLDEASPPRAFRRPDLVWCLCLSAFLVAALLLGRHPTIGDAPRLFAATHLFLVLLLIPLVRGFPAVRRPEALILALALLARLALLPMTPSDDIHRYLWEGRMTAAGVNPYQYAPDAPELEPLRDAFWDRINHKDMTAIYPPGMLLGFGALTRITASPTGYKLAMVLTDMAAVWILLRLLRHHRRRPAWALVYALHPVSLLAYAGEGHLDAVLILCLLATLWMDAAGRPRAMFLALALAIQTKYVAVLALPFLIRRGTRRHLWVLAMAGLAPLLWFLPPAGILRSLTTFSSAMHFNGSLHAGLGLTLGSFEWASVVSALCLAAWVTAVRLRTSHPIEGLALSLSGLLLLSPNVHFWYLTWVLPLLCFYPYRPMLLLSATIVCTYATLGHQATFGVWREFPTLTGLEYLPVYAVLAWTIHRPARPRTLADINPRPPVRTLAIVAPVLNEATILPGFLDLLDRARAQGHEVVLADGGSEDATREIAADRHLNVVPARPGRGLQTADAIPHTTAEVIFVAHADMQWDPDLPERILRALNSSGAPGGCVGCRFDPYRRFLRIIESLNALRARWTGISFGDQGQFFRRDALLPIGGFPALPLMEDVELSLRLRSLATPLFLGGGIRVSSRRWTRSAPLIHALRVVTLMVTYGWRRMIAGSTPATEDLYDRYYGSNRMEVARPEPP